MTFALSLSRFSFDLVYSNGFPLEFAPSAFLTHNYLSRLYVRFVDLLDIFLGRAPRSYRVSAASCV